MNESELEAKVGNIVTRNELIADLLIENINEIAYGLLTLRQVDNGDILPVDFDGRVYETISVGEIEFDMTERSEETEELITRVTMEADERVAQMYDEL